MHLDIGIALQLLNLLLIPAMAYVIKLEKRIFTLETLINVKLDALPCRQGQSCNINQWRPPHEQSQKAHASAC